MSNTTQLIHELVKEASDRHTSHGRCLEIREQIKHLRRVERQSQANSRDGMEWGDEVEPLDAPDNLKEEPYRFDFAVGSWFVKHQNDPWCVSA